jgi:hypothetical protein
MSDNNSKLIIKKNLVKKKSKGLINKEKNNKIIESRNKLFNYYKKKFLTDKINGNIPINRVFNQAPNSFTKYSDVINDLEKNNNLKNKNSSYRNIYQFPNECCCCYQCCYPKFCCCGCHTININNDINCNVNTFYRNNCNNSGFSYLGGLSTQVSLRNCNNLDDYRQKYLEGFLTKY